MSFGANEDVIGHIEADSGAYVSQKVVAAGVVSATECGALKERLVEPETLKSDSTLKIELCPLSQRRSIDGAEVIKNGTVGLKEDVNILVGPPGGFRAYSEILMEQKIAAECRISTAADGLILVVESTIAIACRIAGDGAITES